MSYTLTVEVLDEGEPVSAKVRISVGQTFMPGGRQGLFGNEQWTDDTGHATFEIPDDIASSDKYVNFRIKGRWYGPFPFESGITVNLDSDEGDDDDDDDDD